MLKQQQALRVPSTLRNHNIVFTIVLLVVIPTSPNNTLLTSQKSDFSPEPRESSPATKPAPGLQAPPEIIDYQPSTAAVDTTI